MKTNLLQGYRYPFALVGFGGQPRFWWMRFLKKGFCHCFVLLGNGYEWILIDPLAHFTDIIVLKKVDVKGFLTSQGYRIIRTTPSIPEFSGAQWRPFTCVETVKRILGIKKPFIITPYQLYLHFNPKKGK